MKFLRLQVFLFLLLLLCLPARSQENDVKLGASSDLFKKRYTSEINLVAAIDDEVVVLGYDTEYNWIHLRRLNKALVETGYLELKMKFNGMPLRFEHSITLGRFLYILTSADAKYYGSTFFYIDKIDLRTFEIIAREQVGFFDRNHKSYCEARLIASENKCRIGLSVNMGTPFTTVQRMGVALVDTNLHSFYKQEIKLPAFHADLRYSDAILANDGSLYVSAIQHPDRHDNDKANDTLPNLVFIYRFDSTGKAVRTTHDYDERSIPQRSILSLNPAGHLDVILVCNKSHFDGSTTVDGYDCWQFRIPEMDLISETYYPCDIASFLTEKPGMRTGIVKYDYTVLYPQLISCKNGDRILLIEQQEHYAESYSSESGSSYHEFNDLAIVCFDHQSVLKWQTAITKPHKSTGFDWIRNFHAWSVDEQLFIVTGDDNYSMFYCLDQDSGDMLKKVYAVNANPDPRFHFIHSALPVKEQGWFYALTYSHGKYRVEQYAFDDIRH